jgi:hypothetical protein
MYLRTKMDASNTRLFEKLREEMLAERCGNVSTGSSRGRGGGAGGGAEGRREGEDGEERRDEGEAEGDDACGLAAVVSLAREFFSLFFLRPPSLSVSSSTGAGSLLRAQTS